MTDDFMIVKESPDFENLTPESLLDYFLGRIGPAWGFEEEHEQQIQAGVEKVIAGLEGLASAQISKIHDTFREHRAAWRWTVDWCYCKHALETIPEATDRFLKLSPIVARDTTSREVNGYLREATRCYLWGLFQASVALMRAAVEAGLNESLEKKLLKRPEVELIQKINQAARFHLISGQSQSFANEIRVAANKVLHEESISDQDAVDLLIKTRQVARELFGD